MALEVGSNNIPKDGKAKEAVMRLEQIVPGCCAKFTASSLAKGSGWVKYVGRDGIRIMQHASLRFAQPPVKEVKEFTLIWVASVKTRVLHASPTHGQRSS
jgi:hypothetical protein